MAIQGTIEVKAFGTTVKLVNKYMRLSKCETKNEHRRVEVPQPDGADGNPNNPIYELRHVVGVTGTLEIYESRDDVLAGNARITAETYGCPYDNSADVPEAQLYRHIMTLPEITNATGV
jgi:hypothetical protein